MVKTMMELIQKFISFGSNTYIKGILASLLISLYTVGIWKIQDIRYDNKIKEIKLNQNAIELELKDKIKEQILISQKAGIILANELIKERKKAESTNRKLEGKINELKNNVPPKCTFNAEWVRLYNEANRSSTPTTNSSK